MGGTRLMLLFPVLFFYSVAPNESSFASAFGTAGMTESKGYARAMEKELRDSGTAESSKWLPVSGRKMSARGFRANQPYAETCDQGGNLKDGDAREECDRVLMSSVRRKLHSRARVFSCIPFSSDYHAPKTHPPKNN